MTNWDVPEHHDELVECTFCEEKTNVSVTINYERTGKVTYCDLCWNELKGGKPSATRQQ